MNTNEIVDYIFDNRSKLLNLTYFEIPEYSNLKELLTMWVENPATIVLGKPNSGVVLAILQPYMFNPEVLVCYELLWYSDNPITSVKLLKELEVEAKIRGATRLLIGNGYGKLTEESANKLGYTSKEVSYGKEL